MKPVGTPLEQTMRVIGRKGTLTIMDSLTRGPTRFTTLERILKVSPRTLSERLRELEEQGMVRREAFAEVPPRVEYTLTPKGEALRPLLNSFEHWLERFQPHSAGGFTAPSTDDLRRLHARG